MDISGENFKLQYLILLVEKEEVLENRITEVVSSMALDSHTEIVCSNSTCLYSC